MYEGGNNKAVKNMYGDREKIGKEKVVRGLRR